MATVDRIASALDGERVGHHWRANCPICRKNSLWLSEGNGGNVLVHCWRECDQRELITALRERGLWGGSRGSYALKSRGGDLSVEEKRERAVDLWGRARSGRLCGAYLRARGISIKPPPALRLAEDVFHSATRENRDAVVGLVEHVEYGEIGVHIIYLNRQRDGKAYDLEPNKITRGSFKGGAVRLGELDPDSWLVVGEGIESTLSAMELSGYQSGWAAISVAGLWSLVLPKEAKRVLIAADNDLSYVGQRAAYGAAERFKAEGRTVRVAVPPDPDTDWNDVLNGGGDGKDNT